MSMAHRRLARTMHEHAAARARHSRTTHRGEVIDVDPVIVQLIDSNARLAPADYDMTQSVRRYEARHGVAVGDNVVLIHDEHEWLIIDVLSDEAIHDDTDDRLDDLEAAMTALEARVTALENA